MEDRDRTALRCIPSRDSLHINVSRHLPYSFELLLTEEGVLLLITVGTSWIETTPVITQLLVYKSLVLPGIVLLKGMVVALTMLTNLEALRAEVEALVAHGAVYIQQSALLVRSRWLLTIEGTLRHKHSTYRACYLASLRAFLCH